MPSRTTLLCVCALVLSTGCPAKKPNPGPEPTGRCEVNLDELKLFSAVGTGASAAPITSTDQLIGGEMARGQMGDFLLQNDKVRVVVQRPLRDIGPNPYGGTVIDADLTRPAGQAGHDQLGKLSLLYSFGRIINATQVEVLNDGSAGGFAVIAASGDDTVNDFINLPRVINDYVAGVAFVTSPDAPVTLHATTYYVLSPGESRVRVLTAFCNGGMENVVVPMGDLFEQGGSTDFFNPQGCTNGMGAKNCLVDPTPWYGYQGDGVAYALRSYKISDPAAPEPASAIIAFTGVAGTVTGAQGQQGLLSWLDPSATQRPGSFGIISGQQRNYLRDLFVGRDLGDITSQMLNLDGLGHARLNATVTNPDGTPAPGARIAVISAADSLQKTLLVAGDDGKAHLDLPPGNYRLLTGSTGHAIAPAVDVSVPSTGEVTAALTLGASRTLTVRIKDPAGHGMPGKVTVLCAGGTKCPFETERYRPFYDVDTLPSTMQALGFVTGSGQLAMSLPPGRYEVMVSRGPEYSGWPDTFPNQGQAVDLTTADQSIDATLVQVVDTTGWMSADLHVHAVNSADSSVGNRTRVATFAAEGVDVMVSTDHDVITDYAPYLPELQLTPFMASMIGCEVSPFDFGHQNAYPLIQRDSPNGGAFDWAGGAGPTLRLSQVYAGLREAHPNVVVQMNHPRGRMGSMTELRVDTATLATHATAEEFRMEPAPDATPANSKLLSDDFDAFEIMNGPAPSASVLNDFMTLLSRGSVKVATGVSDTHHAGSVTGGYGRTWVHLGFDAPAQFTPDVFAQTLKAKKALVSNGPFVVFTARKTDAGGTPTGSPVEVGGTLSVTPSAGENVELTVDVQAPEWMTFDSIELYTHTSGREAFDGVSNSEWPASRVLQHKTLTPTMLTLEPVPGNVSARRIHVTQTFTVSPTSDTWYVAFVRGGTGSHVLFPLVMSGVSCSNGLCTTAPNYPWAITNAILIDADGSGKYDDFPLKGQALSAPVPARPTPRRHVPTLDELLDIVRELLSHKHG